MASKTKSKVTKTKMAPVAPPKKPGRKPKPTPDFVEGLPAGSVVAIPLADLNLDDRTFEFRVSVRVGDLVESLKREGQQIPIIVRGEVPYQVVSGFRRVRAIQQVGWTEVMAIVRELTDDQAYALSYLENEIRKDYGALDRANAVVKLRTAGKTYEEIGRLYGLGDKQIQNYETMFEFDDQLKAGIDGGVLTPTHALLIHQAGRGQDGFDFGAWVRQVSEEQMSVADLRKALGKIRPTKAARFFEKRGEGFRLYPMSYNPEKTTPDQKKKLVEALKKAIAVLQK